MDQQELSCKKHDFFVNSSSDAFFRACMSCGFVEDIQLSPGKQNVGRWRGWLQAEPQPLSWPPCVKYLENLEQIPSHLPASSWKRGDRWSDAGVYAYRPNLQTSFQDQPQMDRNPYVYSDLLKSSCIRLLDLSPGNRLDTLSGRLFVVRWEHEPCPSYSALSYTWADDKGDTSPTNLIFLNEEQKVLRITRNCDRALRSLRQKHQSVRLWVDSICINQSSPSERSHQVGLMKTIYSKATTVHAYVGEMECGKDLTGTEAMTLLEDLQLNDNLSMLTSTKTRSIAILNEFFSRPYFARLWIVQELLLARSIRIHCAETSIHVSNESIAQFYEQGVRVPSWVRYVGKLQSNAERSPLDLRDLLVATSVCKVTDLRDKIFGLLGLVSDVQASDLSPDYELMIREVYIGVATYLMQNQQCCDLIQFLNNSYKRENKRENPGKHFYGIPSWVPMWNTTTLLHGTHDLCTHIQKMELECKQRLTNEFGVNYITIRTIDGWPHDEESDCKKAGMLCKTVYSASGFLGTNIETVFRLPLNPRSDANQLRSADALEDSEYSTRFYPIKDNIEVAIRTFKESSTSTSGAHLIRVEGCASSFLAKPGSENLHYYLLGPCVAAIVCRTQEPSPVESLKFEDLRRFSQFTPLTLEMVQFMAKWRSLGVSSIEDQDYYYSLKHEHEIFHQSWRSWVPFLDLASDPTSGFDPKLQRHLPTLAEFWDKTHELHAYVRQWTVSALKLQRQRSFVVLFYKNIYDLKNALYEYLETSKRLVECFKTMIGCDYILQSFQPAGSFFNALKSTGVKWTGDDLLGYPGTGAKLSKDVKNVVESLYEDQLFLDKAFPLELTGIHPKYNTIKETLEWKKALAGLGRIDREAKYVSFI